MSGIWERHTEAVELYIAQKWAIYALIEWKGNKAAKETLIRLAGGRPLAICVGKTKGRDIETDLGTSHVVGKGCLAVFEAATRLDGGRMWPRTLCAGRSQARWPETDHGTP